MFADQPDIPHLGVVGQHVAVGFEAAVPLPGRQLVIHLTVHERRASGFVAEVPLRQMRDPGLHTLHINQFQDFIGLGTLEEHHM